MSGDSHPRGGKLELSTDTHGAQPLASQRLKGKCFQRDCCAGGREQYPLKGRGIRAEANNIRQHSWASKARYERRQRAAGWALALKRTAIDGG